ncbi:MAG: SOS response-associated peptidase [Gammaproteobacteria bacterium]|nr:SOS response-associated peptidase [Gammaproteobacteria bacterium]
MCGRYNIVTSAQGLYDAFKIISSELNFGFFVSSYNVHPSPPAATADQLVTAPIIRAHNSGYEALPAVWPLIPAWAKGAVTKYSTANAKAETLDSARSYQHAWKHAQRCLIPATGFYEWQVIAGQKQKQPYNIKLARQPVFAMAGLWESTIKPENESKIDSFTIITTQANPLMAKIHNTKERMPVIIAPDNYLLWLNGTITEAERLLKPYPETEMTADMVTTYVNNPNNNDEKCIEKIPGSM